MALVSGYLRDFSDVPFAAGLAFIAERPATSGTRLLSTKRIDVSLAANGWFEQDLFPTTSTTPPTKYTVRIVFANGREVDALSGLSVPAIGGSIAGLAASKSERLTYSATKPTSMQVGDMWWDSVTDNIYLEDGTP